MSGVLLVGTGEVGVRAARQLVDTPGIDRVLITGRDPAHATRLADALGDRAAPLAAGSGVNVPEGITAIAIATPDAGPWLRAAAASGVAAATVDDGGTGATSAEGSAAAVVTGCGLGPGLTGVLARHAASALDSVDAVHVARVGAAGPACVEAARAARRETPGEWREGSWRTARAFGPELLWFPEPIGVRECQLVRTGVAACVAAVPGARLVTSRLGVPPTTGWLRRGLRRDPKDQGWGAARVEVSGRRGGIADSLVYGVVDRTAVAAGVVLAVAAATLAGGLDAGVETLPGVRTLGEVTRPVPFLAELGRRGVKAAAFEGVAPH
ncbi:MAG: hypothetical protein ACKOA9_09705 [Actinomycetota bacterium]